MKHNCATTNDNTLSNVKVGDLIRNNSSDICYLVIGETTDNWKYNTTICYRVYDGIYSGLPADQIPAYLHGNQTVQHIHRIPDYLITPNNFTVLPKDNQ